MKRILLTLSALVALVPGMAYSSASATETESVRFVFLDTPGTYKIRVSIIDQNNKAVHILPQADEARELDEEGRFTYEQPEKNEFGRVPLISYIELPVNAKKVRISMRKKGDDDRFARGGYIVLPARELIAGAQGCKDSKKRLIYTILAVDQFEKFAQGKGSIEHRKGNVYEQVFTEAKL